MLWSRSGNATRCSVNEDDLSVSDAGTERIAERTRELYVVRAADSASPRASGGTSVEPWELAWKRSLRMQRELQEQLTAEIQRGQAIVAANMSREDAWRRRFDV